MRLIDADKLKKELYFIGLNTGDIISVVTEDMIDLQPTVYNVDKVIAELEEELNLADMEKERCLKENPLQFDSAKGYAHGIANAIEIVRKGGVE